MTKRLILALLTVLILAPGIRGQESDPAEILILGTYHFANPGQDVVNVEVPDVMTPEKQAQIRAVVDSLAGFRPTKVAVEWPWARAAEFDSVYQAYRAGRHELTRNERQQLGMRLAARLEHPRIYPIDSRGEFAFGKVMEWAREHDPSFVQKLQARMEEHRGRDARMQDTATVGEILRWYNSHIPSFYEPYMIMAEAGADSVYVGTEPVAQYYARNLRIFANLTRIVEPGDRILVIFGAGHAPFLRQFVQGHPEMRLVDPLDHL